MNTRFEILKLVFKFFQDAEKMNLWFETPNPLLGNVTPLSMLINDREEKLLKVLQNMVNGESP